MLLSGVGVGVQMPAPRCDLTGVGAMLRSLGVSMVLASVVTLLAVQAQASFLYSEHAGAGGLT